MLTVVIVVLVVLSLATIAGTVYMLNFALSSAPSSRDIAASYDYIFERPVLREWVDSLRQEGALKDTTVHSDYDGLKLHALYIKAPQETDKTALLIHGYTDNAVRMLMIAHLYNKELGYNVIIPDLSGHGQSEGDWIRMGWLYRYEIKQWIGVARDIFGDSTRIVLHGISMGAATTMMTAGETLPDNVKCFVADCGYTSVWEQFKYQLKRDFSLPSFPLMYTTNALCDFYLGWNFKEASSIKQIEKCDKPVFFIHGDSDTYVPTSMVYELFEAKKSGEKELWVVPGAKHAKAYWDNTDDYVLKVKTFVEKYI